MKLIIVFIINFKVSFPYGLKWSGFQKRCRRNAPGNMKGGKAGYSDVVLSGFRLGKPDQQSRLFRVRNGLIPDRIYYTAGCNAGRLVSRAGHQPNSKY
jgi:hypothetical protein